MAAYTSYDVVGKKEDISDIISNISPTKTPFQTIIAPDKIHNTLFQWQEDSLAAVNLSNAQLDGFDATETAPVATVMRQNYSQIMAKTLKVAETTDAVARYGRAKETAYQVAKYGQELKRDLEGTLLSGQAAVAGSNSVARLFAAYQAQIAGSESTTIGGTLRLKTGGAATTMTEAMLVGTLQLMYTNGVDPDVLMVPPAVSLVVAAYASAAGRYRTIPTEDPKAARKLVNAVDLYVSPFGEVRVVLNRFQLATDSLIFDPSMWVLATLRPWTRETLAKVGDATKMMIVGEFSLKHKNQSASAYVRQAV